MMILAVTFSSVLAIIGVATLSQAMSAQTHAERSQNALAAAYAAGDGIATATAVIYGTRGALLAGETAAGEWEATLTGEGIYRIRATGTIENVTREVSATYSLPRDQVTEWSE